jgi:hypothetical protein
MICEIARTLEGDRLETIETVERDMGMTIVAFSCRELDPEREEMLRQVREQFGLQLEVEPAALDESQLDRIREVETALDLSLLAVRP